MTEFDELSSSSTRFDISPCPFHLGRYVELYDPKSRTFVTLNIEQPILRFSEPESWKPRWVRDDPHFGRSYLKGEIRNVVEELLKALTRPLIAQLLRHDLEGPNEFYLDYSDKIRFWIRWSQSHKEFPLECDDAEYVEDEIEQDMAVRIIPIVLARS